MNFELLVYEGLEHYQCYLGKVHTDEHPKEGMILNLPANKHRVKLSVSVKSWYQAVSQSWPPPYRIVTIVDKI